jgi:hypothetical protein
MKQTFFLAALLCAGGFSSQAESIPARNRHPYRDLDWASAHQILTTTHIHIGNQSKLNHFIQRGFEFFTLSNYYPSAPYYPLSSMRVGQFRVRQDHAVMKNGVLTPGPFSWNEILAPWIDEVDEEFRKSYPFKVGGPMFPDLPENLLEAPNAEHHSFTNTRAHINAPGSMYASGTFDARNRFRSHSKGYNYGTGLPWQDAFSKMLDQLLIPDGGGITINHPHWSSLEDDVILQMLDFDPRVLGIEVYNNCGEKSWSEDYWDRILATGRQCFGFFVPDHRLDDGVNVLIVSEKTAEACLRAYRQGNWYCALKGKGLRLQKITFAEQILEASTDQEATFQVITKQGVVHEQEGTNIKYQLTEPEKHGYLRLKATAKNDSGEILFSQPFMLTP